MGVRRVVLARIDRWVERERGQDGRARKEREEGREREREAPRGGVVVVVSVCRVRISADCLTQCVCV